jgi:DNA invertase Pin-like site-specific DNA recombinase
LEGQEAAVTDYNAKAAGGAVLRAYTEVETGKRADRPELVRALADCKRSKTVLVIAKSERLARNVHFLSGLMEAGVEFVCCDMPSANRLTLHIMAAVAEDEAKRISERTKAALAATRPGAGCLGRHDRGTSSDGRC